MKLETRIAYNCGTQKISDMFLEHADEEGVKVIECVPNIAPKFVSRIPKDLISGILYICIPCQVAVHLCACGCGEKVVTPLDDEKGWQLTVGETVSLSPSIGNFSCKCKSHYYIRNNKIIWL